MFLYIRCTDVFVNPVGPWSIHEVSRVQWDKVEHRRVAEDDGWRRRRDNGSKGLIY